MPLDKHLECYSGGARQAADGSWLVVLTDGGSKRFSMPAGYQAAKYARALEGRRVRVTLMAPWPSRTWRVQACQAVDPAEEPRWW